MKSILDWLDHRTGYRKWLSEALDEPVPGGARWRYVWGSALTFAIFVQFVTGIVLWSAYSPSSQTAWESVYYIQEEMAGGWWLRGIHHYMAQVMTVLLVLHLMQVVIDGAYKAPREVNFWFGMGLLALVMALSLTGYLLPWDQKGYWATKVATNLIGIVPFVGESFQRIVVGGADYGHHTLTRFFSLHAGVLPALTVLFIAGHVYLFRRHGLTAKQPLKKPGGGRFWPDQIFCDAVACLAVLAAVLVLVAWHGGAPLSAPADASEKYPARPDWYFMFLFEFLKWFPGETLIWGGIIIPSLVFLGLCAMPAITSRSWGHKANLVFLSTLLFGFAALTVRAYWKDAKDPEFQFAVEQAERASARVRELA
ncbi:MAG: cytochrome b N-terminal domain-containing protein, partial [Verrucomicrobiae bacterium]|nr:cytochrome b N-terminal domain-containing protein [Verrucomicrobiae bacterium]